MSSGYTHQSPKLLDLVRWTCRRRQYSLHTEWAYVRWIIRFVRFHGTIHPRDLGADDVRAFLSHLVANRNVAASTQNQALHALVFLSERILDEALGDIGTIERADRPKRLPTVLSRIEVRLGHEDVQATMKYLHVLEQSGTYVQSPLDTLNEAGEPTRTQGTEPRRTL